LIQHRENQEKIIELNDVIKQMDIMNIYRLHHLTTKYTFFSNSHGAFTKTDHIVGHSIYFIQN
jgi:hypothetical protein